MRIFWDIVIAFLAIIYCLGIVFALMMTEAYGKPNESSLLEILFWPFFVIYRSIFGNPGP